MKIFQFPSNGRSNKQTHRQEGYQMKTTKDGQQKATGSSFGFTFNGKPNAKVKPPKQNEKRKIPKKDSLEPVHQCCVAMTQNASTWYT